MSNEDIPVTQFTHSIKVEETAKGLRFSVHVYGNNEDETVETVKNSPKDNS
jgi:uncharacterized radical SAM superfamily protein